MTGARVFRLVAFVAIALALLPMPGPAARAATHFPTGSRCYDCHAVSSSKMVTGTHLIKKSDKTVALGITGSSTPIRCLFCHEKNAVSAVGRTEMLGVWDHFDGTSASKHPVDLQSQFGGGNPAALDCVDCHTGLNTAVTSDGAGNAKVHGIDAATESINLYTTLLGSPANKAAVSVSTCQNAACHDADGGVAAQGNPLPRHAMGNATINGVPPTSCTQCHGDHNSYQNTSLIVLRDDGTTSNSPGDPPASRVTPDECGKCHTQDDGATPPYTSKGHGRSDINGGSIRCTGCHTGSVPHGFSPDRQAGNELRFSLNQDTSLKSALRRKPPYDAVFSICLTCHATLADKVHGRGPDALAGCNDCHEPHGVGVGANAKMVRSQVPKADPAGVPVYGDGVSGRTSYESNTYLTLSDAYRADGAGLCDNAECHQGRVVNGNALYPLSSLMSAGNHTGGDRSPGALPADTDYCGRCHSHGDSGGSWAAADSCKSCHGQPPVGASSTAAGYAALNETTTPHRRHAGGGADYSVACQQCHAGYVGPTHDTTPTKSYQDVLFDGALNPTATYNQGGRACLNLYCHSDGQSATSVKASVAWNDAGWDVARLTCHDCHGGIDAGTRIATGAHGKHLDRPGVTCATCHADTVGTVAGDATTEVTSKTSHVNGSKDLKAGAGASFGVGGAKTCTNISCHNGGSAGWNETLSCSDCHFAAADRDNFVYGDGTPSAVSAAQWSATGHGRVSAYPGGNGAAAFAGPAGDPQGCAYCHSFLATAQNPRVLHGVSTNPFRLANKAVLGRPTPADGGWNDVCLVCHSALDADGYDPDGGTLAYAPRNGVDVGEAHVGSKHAVASAGGTFCWDCHDPHGDAGHLMVEDAAAAVTDGVYGVPVSTRPVTGLDATTGGFTSDDLVNGGNTGLCQTCHAAAGGAAFYNRALFTPLAGHNGADVTRCTECHAHPREFSANCTGCHGNTAAGNWWPDGAAEHGTSYANRAGAHQKHVDAIYAANAGTLSGVTVADKKNQTCAWCHPRPGGVRTGTGESAHNVDAAPAATADVHGDGRPSATLTNFKNMAGLAVSGGTFNTTTHVCSTVDCHGGAATPPWYAVVAGDSLKPAVSAVQVNGAAPTANVQMGTPTVTLSASCSDVGTGGSNIVAAEYFVGSAGTPGAGTLMTAFDGAFNSPTEPVTATVDSSGWAANTTVYVDCQDAAGNWGPAVAGTAGVNVTAKDTFTVTRMAGPTEYVYQGDLNKTAEVMTFTVTSAAGTSIQLQGLQVTATGTMAYAIVSLVKIYRDNGTTNNVWDQTDTLLGSATFNSSNVANIAITPTTVTQGTPVRLLIVYDISATAPSYYVVGAQLTGVTVPATDQNQTTLPLPAAAANLKTVWYLTNANYYAVPSNTTLLFGSTSTNYGSNCGTAAQTAGSHYMLANTTNCATAASVWTPNVASATSTSIFNTVLSAAGKWTVDGQAGCNLRIQNTAAAIQTVTCQLVELTSAGAIGNVSGAVSINVPASFALGNLPFSMAGQSVIVNPGNKFGFRFTLPATTTLRPNFGGLTASYNTFVVVQAGPSREVAVPAFSVNPAASPSSIQQGIASVNLTATCSDASTGVSNIVAAEYFVGAPGTPGAGAAMQPTDAAFNSAIEAVTATVDTSTWFANTTLYVDCKDAGGNWGPVTQGSATVTLGARDAFTVSGAAGLTEAVPQGATNTVVEVLTFNATAAGTSALLQGVQITGTKDLAGTGEVHSDVSQVKIFNDTGSTANQWDATDVLLGAAAFNSSNVANVAFSAPVTVANPTAARLLVVYDIVNAPTPGDRIGGNLTGVIYPATDNLTTDLPVASGNVKSIRPTNYLYCGACHALPPDDAATGRSHSKHAAGLPDHTDCDACHPGASSYTNSHADGKWQLGFSGTAYTGVKNDSVLTISNAGTTYYADASTGGVDDGTCSNTGCHGTRTPVWGNSGTVTCAQCHDDGTAVTPNAPTVTASSTHVDADGGGATWAPGDCKGCHAGHIAGVTIPLPPTSWSNVNLPASNMRTVLGINYVKTGGIHLGGPGTSSAIAAKPTEAEICWGCHGTDSTVNEWGFNKKTNTTVSGMGTVWSAFTTQHDGTAESEDYGHIYTDLTYSTLTKDWTAGYLMDEYDPLLKRRIASVHTASFDPSGQSSSVANNVVSGTGKVRQGTGGNPNGDTSNPVLEDRSYIRCSYCHDVHNTFGPAGRPYLRGTWVGNPYPPELPPRTSYPQTFPWGAGPRTSAAQRSKGGYFIDQNSGSPTNDPNMSTKEQVAGLCLLCHGTNVDTMKFYGSTLWLPGMVNGHSNSTLGGTQSNARDLFSAVRPDGSHMLKQDLVYPSGGGCSSYYYRSNVPYPSSGCVYVSDWYGSDHDNWYGSGTIGGAEGSGSMAHKFTCSKCHTPHASGLPALLTHNCIDPAGGAYPNGFSGVAGNCHRKTSTADGWHKLAPGQ